MGTRYWGTGGFVTRKAIGKGIFERYTEATRQAIYYARCEALRRDASVITVSDLLAGLTYEEGTRAERIASLKANASYLRWLATLPSLPETAPDAHAGDNPHEMSAEAKRALSFAVAEADRDREYWIDTDHLLRGLLRFPNTAQFAVLKTEFDLKKARLASRRDREEFLPEQTPNLKVMRYLVRKHLAMWVPPALGLACYLYILIQSVSVRLPLAR